MAQLPPKSPTTVPFWASHVHQKPPGAAQHSWVDEFLEFSTSKRGGHRRSASDSVAYLDPTFEFDRLDDDQLVSMFSDDAPPLASAAPTSPSDDRNNEEEAQSECKTDTQSIGAKQQLGDETDSTSLDPKRVKRILANRQSAQRSRVRKLHYISELERSVSALQTEVSALSPRVAFLDHQRTALTVGNGHLRQRIAALAQDKIFMEAHQEELKKEIERLRQVYHQQNMKKFVGPDSDSPTLHLNKELIS